MSSDIYHQLPYSIVPEVPRGGQWTLIQTPRTPMKKPIVVTRKSMDVKLQFDVTRVGARELDSTTLELISSSVTPVVEEVVSSIAFTEEVIEKIKEHLKEQELRQLVAFSRSIETDPKRLEQLRKMAGEPEYKCYIVWLTLPLKQLPKVYRQVELQLYHLVRHNSDVHVTILDSSIHSNLVADLMKTLGVDSLPILIISSEPIDLKKPKRESTIIIKGGALGRLARHGKLQEFISNIPIWARLGVLKDKVRWEAEVKVLLREIYDQIKNLISINIP